MITWGCTERGFTKGEFRDKYGLECRIQKSSLATEDCIWLGSTGAMHLTQEMAGELGKILVRFSNTGVLDPRDSS